ncbi:MAG: flippase-like domain-containing protein, partial [Winogradskyella sp.]|nr:flippase-like domain-containing protein [Winogradskyella sp.]
MTNIKSILKIVLPLLLGIVLVWFSFSKISFSELLVYFKNANYAWIILGVGLGLLSHLSRAYRWKFMLEPLGYDIKFRNSIMAVFSTYLINYTIPRAGEVARASILTNYEGVPFEKGFGTIVAERLADMLVLVVIIGITLFLEFEFIYDYLFSKFDVIKILIGLILFLSFLTIIIIYVKKGSSKIAQKIKVFFNGLVDGMLSIFKMEKKWPFIAHTIFIWVMYVLMFYVTTFAVPELN